MCFPFLRVETVYIYFFNEHKFCITSCLLAGVLDWPAVTAEDLRCARYIPCNVSHSITHRLHNSRHRQWRRNVSPEEKEKRKEYMEQRMLKLELKEASVSRRGLPASHVLSDVACNPPCISERACADGVLPHILFFPTVHRSPCSALGTIC